MWCKLWTTLLTGNSDALLWSLSGSQGDKWLQGKLGIKSSSTFAIVIEGVRGRGIYGDIAVDDITYSATASCTGNYLYYS